MQKSKLLDKLKSAISDGEYRKLTENMVPHISHFNRETLLEMMRCVVCSDGEVSIEQAAALQAALENYLGIYLPDNQSAWKWIILSCIYLRFICEVPMYPEALVHFEKSMGHGKTVYYNLSTYRPDAIDVAIPRKAKVSILPDWPELNVCYFTDDRFGIGIETVEDGNNRFRIYDIEKTVVDIVFYREKIGIEKTKEVLTTFCF